MELNYKKVMVPIDFSDYSRNALLYSVDFARHFNAELVLIYVVEPIIYPPDFSMGQVALPTIDQEMDTRAREELEQLTEEIIPKEIKTTIIVRAGKPFIEIIETAQDEDVDLVIISTHGRTGMEHILFGSTAEKVVRKSPCPVLTLREPIKGFDYKDAIKIEKNCD